MSNFINKDDKITVRDVRGMIYHRLNEAEQNTWVNWASPMVMPSDQKLERYDMATMAPVLERWVGPRNIKTIQFNELEVINELFQASLSVGEDLLRRDKTTQLQARIDSFVGRTRTHWAKLCSELLLTGAATVTYDGKMFFATDHETGDSGVLSNMITNDISTYPIDSDAATGTPDAPSAEQLAMAIFNGIAQFYTFMDDTGEPLNENIRNFHVVVPTRYMTTISVALRGERLIKGATNALQQSGEVNVTYSVNPRLNAWTDRFVIFGETSAGEPAIIRQGETEPRLLTLDENSDHFFHNREYVWGLDTWRNVGFGLWQKAVMVIMS